MSTTGLKAWSSIGGAILGDAGNFREWGLAGGSKSLGACPEGLTCHDPFRSVYFLSAMR
jgi:hypothetical protein